ncbi:MAG: hypothetical protein WCF65_07820 [Parachlamydiaceae bacterium]
MRNKKTCIVRIFTGCLVTSEIKMHLNHSIKWKQTCIMPAESSQIPSLKIVYHEGKEYIGCFIDHTAENAAITTTAEIAALGVQIKQLLAEYFPQYETKNVEMFVFPQVFVA